MKLYALFGALVLLTYAYVDFRGLELTPHKRQFVAHGVRGSHGGYRSYWYSGYHGGK